MKVKSVRISILGLGVAMAGLLLSVFAAPAFAGGCNNGGSCTYYSGGVGIPSTCSSVGGTCDCGSQAQSACKNIF